MGGWRTLYGLRLVGGWQTLKGLRLLGGPFLCDFASGKGWAPPRFALNFPRALSGNIAIPLCVDAPPSAAMFTEYP